MGERGECARVYRRWIIRRKRSAKWRRRRRRGERNGRERFGYKHYQQRIHAAFRDESIIIVQQKFDRRRHSKGNANHEKKIQRNSQRRRRLGRRFTSNRAVGGKRARRKDENEKHPVRSVWKIRNGRVVLQPVPRNYWPMRHALRLPVLYEIHAQTENDAKA